MLTLIYDPSCSSVQDIKSKVLKHEQGIGFVFGGHIYHKQGGVIVAQQITASTMTRCFNRNNNDDIENSIHTLINMFRHKLNTDYELEVLSTNQTIRMTLCLNQIHVFSVSNRAYSSDYFDLCLYTYQNGLSRCLAFNNKDVDGFSHSGDIISYDGLLHSISVKNMDRRQFYLSVVGYNKKPLHMFASQTPSVCIVNHDTRTVYIVPCPLDIMSMGDKGDFAILAKGTVSQDTLEFIILPRPIVREGINTGNVNSITMDAINEAANTNIVELTDQGNNIHEDDEFVMDFNDDLNQIVQPPTSCEPVLIVQDNYNPPPELAHLKCYYFGCRISEQDEMSEVILPIAGGSTVIGDNVLVHAKEPRVQNYANILKSSSCVVIVVGEEMQNSLIDKCQSKVNAVFIVVPRLQTGDVTDIMNSMCINAVTAMAGPCSLVLAYIHGEYYYYRGVSWPGVVENATYADTVTDRVPVLCEVNTASYPWSFVANMNEVYIGNDIYSLRDIETTVMFTEIGLPALRDFIQQLQVIMSPEKLRLIQTIFLNIVAKREQSLRRSPKVKQMIQEGRFKDIKKYIKAEKAVYVDIVSLLQNTISLQKSSSKKHDINKLVRKELIAANVETAASTTMGVMIDELCTELGTISCLINNEPLQSLLTSIKDGDTVNKWLGQQGYLTNVTEVCPRMNVLDGTTTSALLENDYDDTSYVCPSLSIRNIYDNDMMYESVLFLPLHDKTYEDPYAVSWPNEANDTKIALLRIKMREEIAKYHDLSASSKEVNNVIIYLYFCILERLGEHLTRGEAMRNISRAILSFILCAASSGVCPLPLYQIVSHNASITVPDSSIWWMYFKLRTLWKYTEWDQTIIENKFKHFMVKCVRKYVVDPVTNQLRGNSKKRELLRKCALWSKKNMELEWLRTTIPRIQNGEMPHPYGDHVSTRGGAIINKYLKHEPGHPNREYVLTACAAIVIKRSRNNWRIPIPEQAQDEHDVVIDKRLNLRNLPEMELFKFGTNFKDVVKTLYDNHMNIEKSEELAVALL